MKSTVLYFMFIVLLIFHAQAADLILGSSLQNKTGFVPCQDDTDCDTFADGVCVNSFCQCNGTKFCKDKLETVVMKIGAACTSTANCNIEHSVCSQGKCVCSYGMVETINARTCLKVVAGLESPCEDSVQCYTKVSHSGCQNNKCVCQQQMHEFNKSCHRNVGLGEICHSTGECSLTTFATCTNKRCVCKDEYIQNEAGNRCLEIATKPGAPCYEDVQCSFALGRAACKEGHCKCDELYQFTAGKNMCVRDLLLGEVCQEHQECHGLEDGESRLECILGICKCKSEFHEDHGFCTSGAQISKHVPSMVLFCFLLIFIAYLDHRHVQ